MPLLLAAVSSVGVVLASPDPAAAATPTCNAEHWFKSTSGDFNVDLPAYKSGSSYTKVCTLRAGNTGDGVAALQIALDQCHHWDISVDRSFGAQTDVALSVQQTLLHISSDGIYGSQSRKAMSWPRSDDNPNDKECGRSS
jgi:hypothetical protein